MKDHATSILELDLTSSEAISTILLDIKVEFWYVRIDSNIATAPMMPKMTILVLELSQFSSLFGKVQQQL